MRDPSLAINSFNDREEDLLGKNEKDVEKLITEKTDITYKSWPSKIKEEFLNLITGAFNTIVKKMKKCYDSLSSLIKDKLKEVNNFSNFFITKIVRN